jgi:hypothetical protein
VQSTWTTPEQREAARVPTPTLREYATEWLATRDLELRSREHFEYVLRNHIYPRFGRMKLADITTTDVRNWYAHLCHPGHRTIDGKRVKLKDRPVARAHAYGLLRTILNSALNDEPPLIKRNPCRIKGAGNTKRVSKETEPASSTGLVLSGS